MFIKEFYLQFLQLIKKKKIEQNESLIFYFYLSMQKINRKINQPKYKHNDEVLIKNTIEVEISLYNINQYNLKTFVNSVMKKESQKTEN